MDQDRGKNFNNRWPVYTNISDKNYIQSTICRKYNFANPDTLTYTQNVKSFNYQNYEIKIKKRYKKC